MADEEVPAEEMAEEVEEVEEVEEEVAEMNVLDALKEVRFCRPPDLPILVHHLL